MYPFIYNLKRFLAAFLLFFALKGSFSETMGDLNLDETESTWLSVLSGSAITQPEKTSYGFAVLTDGRMINAFNEDGKILWQQGISGRPGKFLTVTDGDFLLVSVNRSMVTLVNPSGLSLWTTECGMEIIQPVFSGRDKRIFALGKNGICCLGFNGILKWTIETDPLSSELFPQELNDGSLLVFLEAENEGKTEALRLNPFGTVIEKITFSGKIISACSSDYGAVLAFSSGETGTCSVKDNTDIGTYSRWITKTGQGYRNVFMKAKGGEILFGGLENGNLHVIFLNAENGSEGTSFIIPEISAPILFFDETGDKIAVLDSSKASFHSRTGEKIRTVSFPSKSGKTEWDHVTCSASGNLLFTTTNWNLASYRIFLPEDEKTTFRKQKDYESFLSERGSFSFSKDSWSKERRLCLEEGNYGIKELEFHGESLHAVKSYMEKLLEKDSPNGYSETDFDNLFSYDISSISSVISMLPLYGTNDIPDIFRGLLENCEDEAVLIATLKAVQAFGYDPDGNVMNALENLIHRTSPKKSGLLSEEIKAVYEICCFMGRPALYSKGRKLLGDLTSTQYDQKTRLTVRKYFTLLAALKM